MSSKNKKLVALLGGRLYKNSLTLKNFLIPPIRDKLKKDNIDFIIATNNKNAANQFRQIKSIKTVETSKKQHKEFIKRQREMKTNLGAETRETINQYAINNNYDYVVHLDDNITSIFYRYKGKNVLIKKRKPFAFYEIIKILFLVIENSNAGTVGIEMSAFSSKSDELLINSGFPYSFFVHRIDKNFQFENSTEDDILMSIYNGENKRPSAVIRNCFYYGKTGKKDSKDGNRKMYHDLLKENKRGEYISSIYPNIYTRKVSYMVKSSTIQKEPFLQHKHFLKKPKYWDNDLVVDKSVYKDIQKTLDNIIKKELYD